ncbi:MAG: NfeD family protein [Firmicutes bacterium]|nr:NfeD family protein [Bacillota bacterium]
MWFSGLSPLEQAAFIIACIGSGLLLFKIILMIFGISDITEVAFGLDNAALAILFQGFISMMAVGGWTMFVVSRSSELDWWASFLIGIAAGLVGVGIFILIYRAMSKLESDGTVNMENAVGKTAEVYIRIPPKSEGNGKINISLQGRIVEATAVTKGEELIKTGESVKVIAYENNTFVVEKV